MNAFSKLSLYSFIGWGFSSAQNKDGRLHFLQVNKKPQNILILIQVPPPYFGDVIWSQSEQWLLWPGPKIQPDHQTVVWSGPSPVLTGSTRIKPGMFLLIGLAANYNIGLKIKKEINTSGDKHFALA